MKVAAITYSSPWGRAELFVTRELCALNDKCPGIVVVPMIPGRELFHATGYALTEQALLLPIFTPRMVFALAEYGAHHPIRLAKLVLRLIRAARSLRIFVLNMGVLPKSIYIARLMQRMQVNHIYVNWATTPATMGYIISYVSGIPWSFRTHRWDLYQDNMLAQKVGSAEFVLCVSDVTRRALLDIAGHRFEQKVFVRRMGIHIEPLDASQIGARILSRRQGGQFRIATPANLVTVKGHRYLLEACMQLLDHGISNFHLTLFGEGPLRTEIESRIAEDGLRNHVDLPGAIPNEQLLRLYRDNEVDLVVLPSILTSEGEHEGLPTVLVEAMAFGVPVLSTNTGGIPELLADGAGVVVEDKSSSALACAIERFVRDPEFAVQVAVCGRERVRADYDIAETVEFLLSMMRNDKVS